MWVNTDLVKEGEIRSAKDLLDPKWRGRTLSAGIRTGGGFGTLGAVRKQLGDTVVRQLLQDQQLTVRRDRADLAREMVRGTFPICLAMERAALQDFLDQGLGKNLKRIDLPEAVRVTGYGIWLFNRAPHPNAAKLFVNWFLAQQGQEAWSKATGDHSPTGGRRPCRPVGDPGSETLLHVDGPRER